MDSTQGAGTQEASITLHGFGKALLIITALGVVSTYAVSQAPRVTLTGLAVLPADTSSGGPPSGAWRRGDQPGVSQFPGQPAQGVSSLWPDGDGRWLALSDNGFGAKLNSADYLLRIYRASTRWGTATGASGAASVDALITLADPDRKLPFPIVRETTTERWLTGGDLDPESFVRAADGTFWVGDEFGPFLLHFSAAGRLLEAPYEVAGLRSPDHPHLPAADAGETSAATARRSRGFEGLAIAGDALYAALEAGTGADADAALVFEFDMSKRVFSGARWRLPLTSASHALTEFVALDTVGPQCTGRFLGIERDSRHGSEARLKRVVEVQLAGNAVTAHVVADLMDIANPLRLGGHPARFRFPFLTTEAVWPTSAQELVIVNDNNFPAGGGRPGYERDPTEFIRVRLDRALCAG